MKLQDLPSTYELIEDHPLPDLNSDGYLLRHKKSGARIAVISNDDENKVFYIGFRTPVSDSTGVPHIIEHTVLCGSERYPVKDPFVELVKGSLNTFLNAMTYPDKTVYPVASTNDKDFKNLCGVYLDAVFHPNIYHYEEIFKQEGWHYELPEKDADLTINGVVYNEMKGAFSSPEDVLERLILNSLYPDTGYGFESGGDPKDIPTLTYENYLNFHRRFYHPANSYIYLYGDMDVAERLRFMDEEYLSAYDAIDPDSAIKRQPAFEKRREVVSSYNIASSEEETDNTYLSLSFSVGDALNLKLTTAFDILDYALLDRPGAPVKQALLDAGIGKDIIGGFDSGTLQPMFSIIAKNANTADKERFLSVITEALKKEVQNGLPEKTLLAAINSSEFRFREADYGTHPKGLIYGLDMLESWIYDEAKPFLNLEILPVFAELRNECKTGYFEELIQTYLIDNPHAVMVVVEPEKGLLEREEQALAEHLQAYKDGLSAAEVEKLISDTAHLTAYQEEVSPQEDLEKIPMLQRSDIRPKVRPIVNEEITIGTERGIFHDYFTNGIAYLRFLFDTSDLSEDELSDLGILRSVLGYMNTAHYDFTELSDEINLYTGGIGGQQQAAEECGTGEMREWYELKAKCLYDNLPQTVALLKEILCTTDLSDEKRLYEILAELKSRLQMSLSSAGHQVAITRASSYFSPVARHRDLTSGIAFYRLVDRLEQNFDAEKTALITRLSALMQKVFGRTRVIVSLTMDHAGLALTKKRLPEFLSALPESPVGERVARETEKKNEGFLDASQVQYVARAGKFDPEKLPYTGTLRILRTILSYDYLWQNIRVKGGAYGCMSGFLRSGDSFFASYRDPNLAATNEVFCGVPDYVREFSVSERDMTKFVIGTVSELDTPLNPDAKGVRSTMAYMTGLSESDLQAERDAVLSATEEDIRALAPYIETILDMDCICAVGNENVIGADGTLFDRKEHLL